jgi:hypothetical protein
VWLTALVDNVNILMLFLSVTFGADVFEVKNVPGITYHGRKITALCSIFCVLSYQL